MSNELRVRKVLFMVYDDEDHFGTPMFMVTEDTDDKFTVAPLLTNSVTHEVLTSEKVFVANTKDILDSALDAFREDGFIVTEVPEHLSDPNMAIEDSATKKYGVLN